MSFSLGIATYSYIDVSFNEEMFYIALVNKSVVAIPAKHVQKFGRKQPPPPMHDNSSSDDVDADARPSSCESSSATNVNNSASSDDGDLDVSRQYEKIASNKTVQREGSPRARKRRALLRRCVQSALEKSDIATTSRPLAATADEDM